MIGVRLAPAALALLALALPMTSAEAHSPRTRATIVARATTLMPDVVQTQFKRHARALYAAALDPSPLDASSATPDADRAELMATALEAAIDEAVSRIENRRPMNEVADAFGRIAALCATMTAALELDEDPREARIRADWQRFVESRLPRIAVVFHGFEEAHLGRDDVRGFAMSTMGRVERDYGSILRSYFPEGRPANAADFDDRSVAFAAASLGISEAVTMTARAWLYTWKRANGDLAGAPLKSLEAPFGGRPPQRTPGEEHSESGHDDEEQ